jgi:hypothetical protein
MRIRIRNTYGNKVQLYLSINIYSIMNEKLTVSTNTAVSRHTERNLFYSIPVLLFLNLDQNKKMTMYGMFKVKDVLHA